MQTLRIDPTDIPGLLIVHLPLHGDPRGWVKENWQRAKMTALGLPDFAPVQHTITFNAGAGITRGFHAEPWDKLVSIAAGRAFGAWVDLREGETFGRVVTHQLSPEVAVFVPQGVANSFQTLETTTYSYLVNDHWSPEATNHYTYLNLADETVAIPWPIPLANSTRSAADLAHPRLADVTAVQEKDVVILGANGQLGRALQEALPRARALSRADLNLADPTAVRAFDWQGVGTIINAAAYTAVDQAETPHGRRECWATNVSGVAALADIARARRIKLVQLSSDYVFDGVAESHDEDEPLAPLGVYGQTKAAGEQVLAGLPDSLIVRTSWVVGEGHNFVATMKTLAEQGAAAVVISDQVGRLTFAPDLAAGIVHALAHNLSGILHVTNTGEPASWYAIAAKVFELCGRDPADVTPTTTAEYAAGKLVAPRPANSVLDLSRLRLSGFEPADFHQRLARYVSR